MQPRVIAVLVARDGAEYLPRTLAALAAQHRKPDSIIVVDAGSTDASAELLRASTHTQLVSIPGRRSFGAAVTHALRVSAPQVNDDEWIWLLAHDNAPEPLALSSLLGAVEVAPSVAIAGPKLMSWDEPDLIAGFGETLTAYGRSVELVRGELDQAQHDVQSDLLGVAAGGMLVRRQVWTALGGFDPALPSADSALDFSIRARLAGHRVIGVPTARVSSGGPPEAFGRRALSAGLRNRIRRAAQLHRRLVYAPAFAVPLHWLTLVPLAILRSLMHIAAKRPSVVGGELAAGIGAMLDAGVVPARSVLRRNRATGWGAIAALRMPQSEVAERRANERVAASSRSRVVTAVSVTRVGFFSGGGAWVVLLAGVIGLIAYGRFMDAPAIAGGAMLPLSETPGELWSHVGYAWRDIGSGFTGAADPFAVVLAALGSLAFWSPSASIVGLYLIAMPLAALSAWFATARFTERAWAPAVAAVAWALAPPLLSSMAGGHLGSVIAHILLPTLLLVVVNASRSWSMAAIAALLFAVVAASAPVLVPALTVALVAFAVVRPRGALRMAGIPIPTAALFAPLVYEQVTRGNPIALLSDPGLPFSTESPTAWQLALGGTRDGALGWDALLAALGADGTFGPVVAGALLAPFGVLAVLALFLPGSRRAIPAMAIALVGFITAVASTNIHVTIIGAAIAPIWPGAGLSLYWLGLVGSMALAIEALRAAAAAPALAAALGLGIVGVPPIAAAATAMTEVAESTGRMLPAFVSAEAASSPALGTLALTPQPDGGLAATVHRGLGTTLDEQSTLAATSTDRSEADTRLAILAGNIASRSGFDSAKELDALHVSFVLLRGAAESGAGQSGAGQGGAGQGGSDQRDIQQADAVRQRVADALDGNRTFTPIGNTDAGYLWHYAELGAGAAPGGPGPLDTQVGAAILIGQAVVFGMTLLVAIPTSTIPAIGMPIARRKRVVIAKGEQG